MEELYYDEFILEREVERSDDESELAKIFFHIFSWTLKPTS